MSELKTLAAVLRAFADAEEGGPGVQHAIKGSRDWSDSSYHLLGLVLNNGTIRKFDWRTAPVPRMVPLGPEDVPPGSVLGRDASMSRDRPFRFNGEHLTPTVCERGLIGVWTTESPSVELKTWSALFNSCWGISRDGGKTWERCERPEKEASE